MKSINSAKALLSLTLLALVGGCSSGSDGSDGSDSSVNSMMKPGMQYVYYSDGSCKPDDTRECVDQAFINTICENNRDIDITNRTVDSYDAGKVFRTLYNANGASIEVRLVGNACYAKMEVLGMYKGTNLRLTRDCKVNALRKHSTSGKILVSGYKMPCFTEGL